MRLLARLVIMAHLWAGNASSALSAWALRHARRITRALWLALGIAVVLVLADRAMRTYQEQAAAAEQFQQEAARAVAYADSVAEVDKVRQKRIRKLQGDVAWLRSQIPDQQTTDSLREIGRAHV